MTELEGYQLGAKIQLFGMLYPPMGFLGKQTNAFTLKLVGVVTSDTEILLGGRSWMYKLSSTLNMFQPCIRHVSCCCDKYYFKILCLPGDF